MIRHPFGAMVAVALVVALKADAPAVAQSDGERFFRALGNAIQQESQRQQQMQQGTQRAPAIAPEMSGRMNQNSGFNSGRGYQYNPGMSGRSNLNSGFNSVPQYRYNPGMSGRTNLNSGFSTPGGYPYQQPQPYYSGYQPQPSITYSPSNYGTPSYSTPTYSGSPSVSYSTPSASSTTFRPVPSNTIPAQRNTIPTGGTIKIALPDGEAGTVYYSLNDYDYSIEPGESQEIENNRVWTVRFHRGGEYGEAKYTLKPGAYHFKVGDRGWELFRQKSH